MYNMIIINNKPADSRKGRTISKVMGGRGGGLGDVEKQNHICMGKLRKKIHPLRVAQKKIMH